MQRAGAERHHQAEPARLGELREARDEQRADDERRLPHRRPQPRLEHERESRREPRVEDDQADLGGSGKKPLVRST